MWINLNCFQYKCTCLWNQLWTTFAGDPGARWYGVRAGYAGGAPLPWCPDHGDIRGHQRDTASRDSRPAA